MCLSTRRWILQLLLCSVSVQANLEVHSSVAQTPAPTPTPLRPSTTPQSALHVACCDIRNMLAKYISSRGGLREEQCDPATCNQDREVKAFILHTKAGLRITLEADSNQDVLVHVDSLSSQALSELMVWAFIGRIATKRQQGEAEPSHMLLEYDTITQQISVEEPKCTLYETVYQIMITIAILAIISIMLLQSVKEIEHVASKPECKTHPGVVCWSQHEGSRSLRIR